MSTTYTLQVNLDDTELALLKNSGYSLCIAKKVNNVYNVVWNGGSFLAKNTFQWTEDYAVFGDIEFKSGALINAGTNILPIALGQSTNFDVNGIFQPAQGAPGGASITIDNNYGTINFGVQAELNGNFAPIYLDTLPAVTGVETLTPIVSVMVWFDRTLSTSTMFTSSVSRAFEIAYTDITTQTVSYVSDPQTNSGIWVFGDPTSGQGLQYSPHKIYDSLTNSFEDLPFANDQSNIRALVDKYLSSSVGKATVPRPKFLVQATVTLPPTCDALGAVAFLKVYLHTAVVADFTVSTDQSAGNNKVIIARLGWSSLVQLKTLIVGVSDIGKLEQIFQSALNVYGPGYLSVKFLPLQ